MKPKIGIADDMRRGVVELLSTLLADEYVLYTKTRNYHWNVEGMQFNDLHKFFEAQYEALDEVIDEVAERARSLGGRALGTLAEFSQRARLKEEPKKVPDAKQMLGNLLADHETLVRELRADLQTALDKFGDAGTSDFLTGLMEKHEKMAWMLRSFLS
ncbi:MAG TPA: DNA starvation/stationary phase protection protein [Methylomirabilota bacterium]|nr:DNA starvation/stationary phase protection protein [Methylomirabilota bacterium]